MYASDPGHTQHAYIREDLRKWGEGKERLVDSLEGKCANSEGMAEQEYFQVPGLVPNTGTSLVARKGKNIHEFCELCKISRGSRNNDC